MKGQTARRPNGQPDGCIPGVIEDRKAEVHAMRDRARPGP